MTNAELASDISAMMTRRYVALTVFRMANTTASLRRRSGPWS
jgi:hypothetical protein